jgi:hypothetical protein
MSRVVLFASLGAVVELATCVGLHNGTVRGAATASPQASNPTNDTSASPDVANPMSDTTATSRVAEPSPPAAPRASSSAPEHALESEWNRLALVDGAACRQKLGELGVAFRNLPDQSAPDAHGCGIPHGVLVQRGPSGITYSPPLQIDCSLALELTGIERIIQDQARAHLESPIRSVTTFGTYSCRNVRGGFTGKLSEHALGNAIDIGVFTPGKGRAIVVARDYRPGQDAPDERSMFLRGTFWALRQDAGLTYVIGPETRADHHDHFHVDRAEPWWQRAGSGA